MKANHTMANQVLASSRPSPFPQTQDKPWTRKARQRRARQGKTRPRKAMQGKQTYLKPINGPTTPRQFQPKANPPNATNQAKRYTELAPPRPHPTQTRRLPPPTPIICTRPPRIQLHPSSRAMKGVPHRPHRPISTRRHHRRRSSSRLLVLRRSSA